MSIMVMISLNRINVKIIFEFEALFLRLKEYNIYISYVQLNELLIFDWHNLEPRVFPLEEKNLW
jgi:hypothetical protein